MTEKKVLLIGYPLNDIRPPDCGFWAHAHLLSRDPPLETQYPPYLKYQLDLKKKSSILKDTHKGYPTLFVRSILKR